MRALLLVLSLAACGDDTRPLGAGGTGAHGSGGSGGGMGDASGDAGFDAHAVDAPVDAPGQCLGMFETCTLSGIPCCAGLECIGLSQCLPSTPDASE